jgi:hypothetical protein
VRDRDNPEGLPTTAPNALQGRGCLLEKALCIN